MLGFGISPTQRIKRSEIVPDHRSTPAHRNSTGGKESRMDRENKKGVGGGRNNGVEQHFSAILSDTFE